MPAIMPTWRGFSGRPPKSAKAVTSWYPIFIHVKGVPAVTSALSVRSNGPLLFKLLGLILFLAKEKHTWSNTETSRGAMNGYSLLARTFLRFLLKSL